MKTKLIILTVAGLLLFGCSKKFEEPEVLYQKALKASYNGSFESASNLLGKIDEAYPYTTYAKNASILLAYATYKKKDYDDLLPIIDLFLKTNPKDESVPYLLYIKAISFYDRMKSHKKDKQILEEYLNAASILTSNFGSSQYAKDLESKTLYVNELIIEGELDVALQYHKGDSCIAAINRYLGVMHKLKGKNLEIAQNNIRLCLQEFEIQNYILPK